MRKSTHSKARPKTAGNGAAAGTLADSLENYLHAHPLKLLAQAAALGCALRYLPVRALVRAGARLAGPLAFLRGVWEICQQADRKFQNPGKTKNPSALRAG